MEIEAPMKNKPVQQTKQSNLGERLKTAREAMHLTEKEAALRLNLSTNIILLMENEDFQNGPPATFIRGYLRSYARLLNIPEYEINTAVAQLESSIPQTPEPSAPPILKTQAGNQTHHYLRRMTYAVVAILIVLVSIWWTSHPKDLVPRAKSIPIPNVVAVAPQTIAATPALTPLTKSEQNSGLPQIFKLPSSKAVNSSSEEVAMAHPEPGLEQNEDDNTD